MRRRSDKNGISTDVDGSTGFVRFHGEVDITAVAEIEQAFSSVIDAGAQRIVVDFTRATFVDSKAIEAAMRGAQAARLAGRAVAAVCEDGHVWRAIEICGLDHAMSVHPSQDEAMAALLPARS